MNVTDEMVEAGLQHYSEGGCMGLDTSERRDVVRLTLEAALSPTVGTGEERHTPAPETHVQGDDDGK